MFLLTFALMSCAVTALLLNYLNEVVWWLQMMLTAKHDFSYGKVRPACPHAEMTVHEAQVRQI